MSYEVLYQEIHSWSIANFGQNRTEYLNGSHGVGAELGSLAALMGMGEELGELWEAGNDEDLFDALGDFCIYLIDYCNRQCIPPIYATNATNMAIGDWDKKYVGGHSGALVVYLGKLWHATLKRHQNIRGFDERSHYDTVCRNCVAALWQSAAAFARSRDKDLLTIVSATWMEVVSKRDWKKLPGDGGSHTHETGNA